VRTLIGILERMVAQYPVGQGIDPVGQGPDPDLTFQSLSSA
jgi:hypothetical protein